MKKIGKEAVKEKKMGTKRRRYPEYESIRAICEKEGCSYQEVYDIVRRELF